MGRSTGRGVRLVKRNVIDHRRHHVASGRTHGRGSMPRITAREGHQPDLITQAQGRPGRHGSQRRNCPLPAGRPERTGSAGSTPAGGSKYGTAGRAARPGNPFDERILWEFSTACSTGPPGSRTATTRKASNCRNVPGRGVSGRRKTTDSRPVAACDAAEAMDGVVTARSVTER